MRFFSDPLLPYFFDGRVEGYRGINEKRKRWILEGGKRTLSGTQR